MIKSPVIQDILKMKDSSCFQLLLFMLSIFFFIEGKICKLFVIYFFFFFLRCKSVYVSTRSGAWIIPNYIFGFPTDLYACRAFFMLPWRLGNTVLETIIKMVSGNPKRCVLIFEQPNMLSWGDHAKKTTFNILAARLLLGPMPRTRYVS